MDRNSKEKRIENVIQDLKDYKIELENRLNKPITDEDVCFVSSAIASLTAIRTNYNEDIYYYARELDSIINERNRVVHENEARDKPVKLDLKTYIDRTISKLNCVFRSQKKLSKEEAEDLYNDYNYLNKKYLVFMDLIDYINDNGINIIPDRMLFCAYLGISTDQYQHFLGSIDENIKAIFNSIEEWIITSKMNSSEIGTRNNQAIKVNLSYDKVGNGLRPNDNAPINFNTALVTNEDIMKKMLANGYDGIGTVENKKDKVVAEIAEFEKE